MAHQLQARPSVAHQHLDDMLHSEYLQSSHEAHRPAPPVASSAAAAAVKMEEAAALEMELQASDGAFVPATA
jgi:hypothetical protein